MLPMAVTFQVRRLAFATLGQLDWHFTPSVVRRGLQPLRLQPWIDWRDADDNVISFVPNSPALSGNRVLNFPAQLGRFYPNELAWAGELAQQMKPPPSSNWLG
jgi:hypothetical protein